MTYDEFLKSKTIRFERAGFEPVAVNEMLFPFQRAVVEWACRIGRAAIFADCGMGKTPMQVCWADNVVRHTGGDVLIVAPLAVSKQTQREAEKFGYSATVCRTMDDVRPGINITNYEMLQHFDATHFSGVVLDESSILKSYMGKTKRQIVDAFANTPYRLACTATPSPNDLMELLNHAEFLGVMKSNAALAVWFIAEQSQSGHYRLKGHAQESFWQWVASWAVAMSKPSDLGDYSDEGFILPPLSERNVVVEVDESEGADGTIFRNTTMSATGYQREKKATLEKRCRKAAEIVNGLDGQAVVWCYRNDEADLLKQLIPDAVEVRGSDSVDAKEKAVEDFTGGRVRVLVSKPTMFGFGINMQQCHEVVFCGLDYSYESYYQAVRRCYRFGQKSPVTVYRVVGETELGILETIRGKAAKHEDMTDSIARRIGTAQRGAFFKIGESADNVSIPDWMVSNAD